MSMPNPGDVIADLDTLKRYVGARGPIDDVLLKERLDVATEYVYERVMIENRLRLAVQEAILLLASRLYKRRQSPEGVAGFGGEGAVVNIVARDPDIVSLLEQHLDYSSPYVVTMVGGTAFPGRGQAGIA